MLRSRPFAMPSLALIAALACGHDEGEDPPVQQEAKNPCVRDAQIAGSSLTTVCNTGFTVNAADHAPTEWKVLVDGFRGMDDVDAQANYGAMGDEPAGAVKVEVNGASSEVAFDFTNDGRFALAPKPLGDNPEASKDGVFLTMTKVGGNPNTVEITCPGLDDFVDALVAGDVELSKDPCPKGLSAPDYQLGCLPCPELDSQLAQSEIAVSLVNEKNFHKIARAAGLDFQVQELEDKYGSTKRWSSIKKAFKWLFKQAIEVLGDAKISVSYDFEKNKVDASVDL